MSRVKCSIDEGKFCNEEFCQYLHHQQLTNYWLEMWKRKITKELEELKKKDEHDKLKAML